MEGQLVWRGNKRYRIFSINWSSGNEDFKLSTWYPWALRISFPLWLTFSNSRILMSCEWNGFRFLGAVRVRCKLPTPKLPSRGEWWNVCVGETLKLTVRSGCLSPPRRGEIGIACGCVLIFACNDIRYVCGKMAKRSWEEGKCLFMGALQWVKYPKRIEFESLEPPQSTSCPFSLSLVTNRQTCVCVAVRLFRLVRRGKCLSGCWHVQIDVHRRQIENVHNGVAHTNVQSRLIVWEYYMLKIHTVGIQPVLTMWSSCQNSMGAQQLLALLFH